MFVLYFPPSFNFHTIIDVVRSEEYSIQLTLATIQPFRRLSSVRNKACNHVLEADLALKLAAYVLSLLLLFETSCAVGLFYLLGRRLDSGLHFSPRLLVG